MSYSVCARLAAGRTPGGDDVVVREVPGVDAGPGGEAVAGDDGSVDPAVVRRELDRAETTDATRDRDRR